MRPGFSLTLDLIRIAAAMVVFLGHLAFPRISGELLAPLRYAPYGHHAVVVFFVLSGLVMAYVVSERETGHFALYEYDMRAKRMGRLVFGHPKYEVVGITTSDLDGRLLAVHYRDEGSAIHYIDSEYRRRWAPIHDEFDGLDIDVVSTDHESSRVSPPSAEPAGKTSANALSRRDDASPRARRG